MTFEDKLAEARVAAAKEGISLRDYVQREHKKRLALIREATGGFEGFEGFIDGNFRKEPDHG